MDLAWGTNLMIYPVDGWIFFVLFYNLFLSDGVCF